MEKLDPLDLLRELAQHGSYLQTEEAAMDRYRDFRRVFLSDEGKRVLGQIMCWAHCMQSTSDPDPYQMAILNGQRDLGLMILSAVEIEPKARPKQRKR